MSGRGDQQGDRGGHTNSSDKTNDSDTNANNRPKGMHGRGRGRSSNTNRGGRVGGSKARRGKEGRGGRGSGRGRGRGGRSNGNQADKTALSATAPDFVPGATIEANERNSANTETDDSKKNGEEGVNSRNNKSKGSKNNKQRGSQTKDRDKKKNVSVQGADQSRSSTNNKKKTDEKKAASNKKHSSSSTQMKPGKKDHRQNNSHSKNDMANSNNGSGTVSIPPSQPQTTNDLNYKRGEKITILHIAEKPSISQAIAKGLSKNGETQVSGGKMLPVHEFTLPFSKSPNASKCVHKVTSVAGHVFNVDFPIQYQSWDTVDPADLFHAPIEKKPCKGAVVKHLQDAARGVNFIVLWLDCDREGENIAFEVLDCCMHLMDNKGSGGGENYDRVYRAYFSAINPSDIQKAYGMLGKPDKNQSLAVDARQELDLKVGVAFSRFQTRYFQGRYGDLDSAVLSYGPCQTPTLGFCVKRHLEIETFKPEPYWTMNLGLLKTGRVIRAQWDSVRSFNKHKVEQLIRTSLDSTPPPVAQISNIVSKEKKQGKPIGLNTVNLLKACSKALGIGPHHAMQTAERLYLSGYLSYPRTESSAYPKSFDIKGALVAQASDSRWGNYVSNLLNEGHGKSRGGVDMGDHPPITPCRASQPHELSGDMARVYELVTRHFIASVSHDAVWQSTKISINIDSLGDKGNFTIRGKQLISPGFLAVLLHKEYGDEKDDTNDPDNGEEVQNLPEFTIGETFSLSSSTVSSSSKVSTVLTGSRATLDIKEKMTTPPTHLSESELISQMEKHGIGTDASIATHIENIMKRNYAELGQGRKIIPSKLGLVLAQGYYLIDASLVLPQIRAEIEDECNKIAKGLADKDTVIKKAIQLFEAKFENFVTQISKMDVLFSSSFAQLQDVGKPFTRCGLTSRYMQYIIGPPPRLYNKFTETVYPLPIGGLIKEWNGRKCPVPGCHFELSIYSVGQPQRSFPLCPNCFNNPRPEWGKTPDENMKSLENKGVDDDDQTKEKKIQRLGGRSITLECPLPDKHPLIEALTASPDPDSDGVLILDPNFGPKWRLVSTRSPTIVHLPKTVESVSVLDKTDEVLGCHFMKIEFKADVTPLKDGATRHVSCFPTDELLQDMVRVHHGEERTRTGVRGGRGGRGRGRGRGGRGRGRR